MLLTGAPIGTGFAGPIKIRVCVPSALASWRAFLATGAVIQIWHGHSLVIRASGAIDKVSAIWWRVKRGRMATFHDHDFFSIPPMMSVRC
jgi:hypothetical protein